LFALQEDDMSDLMTFIGGAAVGTLVTYIAKNKEARQTVENFVDGVGAAFTETLHRLTPEKEEQTVAPKTKQKVEKDERAKTARKTRRQTAKAKKVTTEEMPIH
jgi:hypothetical protein